MTATSHSPDPRRLERWAAPIALLVLAGLAMGNIIPNKFTRDDIGLILEAIKERGEIDQRAKPFQTCWIKEQKD